MSAPIPTTRIDKDHPKDQIIGDFNSAIQTRRLTKILLEHCYYLNKALIKDEEADSVDVHLYRSMIGSLMYLIASRPDIRFVVYACARFQITPKISHLHVVKRQTIVANSTTEVEYVAAANCCRQSFQIVACDEIEEVVVSIIEDRVNTSIMLYVKSNYLCFLHDNSFGLLPLHKIVMRESRRLNSIIDGKAVVVSESSVEKGSSLYGEVAIACLNTE
ncbi:hypothetical protein Tco_0268608 [Tanacetum coccineum]